jgi:hypothetical protein
MTIEDFAARHRVRIKRDEEGETIVLAKSGPIYVSLRQHGVGEKTRCAMPLCRKDTDLHI